MKMSTLYYSLSFLLFLQCSIGVSKNNPAKDSTIIPINNSDTIKKLIVDDYPVTTDMFGDRKNAMEIKSGPIRSLDKAWFSNDELDQTLVFELYTDDYRAITYHFINRDIPEQLIRRMMLNSASGDTISIEQKAKYFNGFLKQSKRIKPTYFVSNKGLKLGDSKEKILKLYGTPDKTQTYMLTEEYEWNFEGDLISESNTNKTKPIAQDSYGHTVIMYFMDNKLIAQILYNDIP